MKVHRVRRHGNAYRAHLEPCDGFYVGATGDDAAQALHQASKVLDLALKNPVVRAALPPGTAAAVAALRGATAALQRGQLDEYLARAPAAAARVVSRTLRKVLPW